jgi:hypothetical protein
MKYFIAPRSGEKSYRNFESTIKHGVPYENIEQYLDNEGRGILRSEPVIYSWGNRPGTKKHWDNMDIGDTVIFYAKGEFVMSGEVYFKQHSPALALAMWPPDENGNPWEYTFFLKNLKYFQLPMRAFNWITGYKSNFIIQGFMELKGEAFKNILKQYGSIEEMLNTFTSSVSSEAPKTNEKLYVNVETDIEPVIVEIPSLKPKTIENPLSIKKQLSKKIDYIASNKSKAITGSKGEAIVLEAEIKRLNSVGRGDLAAEVRRVSMTDDNLGYDISSFNNDGTVRYIEVKATSSDLKGSVRFYLSANEMRKSQDLDSYFIYFIDAVNTKNPRITMITPPFEEQFLVSTDTYILEAEAN